MDDVTRNTFELCLKEWMENSLLFKNPQKWHEGLRQELTEIPRLEGEVKALGLEIDLRLQSLLLDAGFNADEIFELIRLPATAIDIIDSSDGGLEEWKQSNRNCRRWPPMIS